MSDSVSHISRRPSLSSRLSGAGGSVFSSATSNLVSMHPETMEVRLEADDIGYGMSLKGGATERGEFPIIIASIEEGGPAARWVGFWGVSSHKQPLPKMC